MKIFKKIENLFAASAFAEAGEFETARVIAAEEVEDTRPKATVTSIKVTPPKISDRSSGALEGAGSEN
jgi:hypothetical protein